MASIMKVYGLTLYNTLRGWGCPIFRKSVLLEWLYNSLLWIRFTFYAQSNSDRLNLQQMGKVVISGFSHF